MSTSASSVKLEDVNRTAVNDTDAEAATPQPSTAESQAQTAESTEAAAATAASSAASSSPASTHTTDKVPDAPAPKKDRYGRGIIVGILFSCFVALIPLSIGMSMGTKQQETLNFTRGQVVDLRTNLALYELNELQSRMGEITAAEQQLQSLIQEKAGVSEQIADKQAEIQALQLEADRVRSESASLLEQAKTELNTTVSDSLSRITN